MHKNKEKEQPTTTHDLSQSSFMGISCSGRHGHRHCLNSQGKLRGQEYRHFCRCCLWGSTRHGPCQARALCPFGISGGKTVCLARALQALRLATQARVGPVIHSPLLLGGGGAAGALQASRLNRAGCWGCQRPLLGIVHCLLAGRWTRRHCPCLPLSVAWS